MQKPWIEGPAELLIHAHEHLSLGSSFDNRIALISIDNAVELTIKTYLELPKRITKIKGLSRKQLDEAKNNFSALLDVFENFGSNKIVGIDLGDIEWYHRLRNQLYHEGNGITVDTVKVESYAEIAKILYNNIFEEKFELPENYIATNVGKFISTWAEVEKKLTEVKTKEGKRYYPTRKRIQHFVAEGKISQHDADIFIAVNKFRNELVHGVKVPSKKEISRMTKLLMDLLPKILSITTL